MKKKKLLVTASTFPRWKGDTEPRFILDISKELNQYFDVTVLVPMCPNAKKCEILEGVKVIRYHYFPIHKWETLCYPGAIVPRIKEKKIRVVLVPFLFISLYIKLLFIIRDYDIVHAHWLIPQGIVQSFFKKPYIVTGHGGDVTSLNKGTIRILKKRCLKKASYVTVVSEALKSEVMHICNVENLEILSMGCHVKNFSTEYRQDNYFGQGEKKVVLFVGRLAEKKGVKYLIEAMNNVDAKLVVVGNGPLRKELEEQAHRLDLDILFMGSKSHDELKTIYASADIFCAPSVVAKDGDKEGLGLVLLEAMASGIPVVASESGGIIEIISNEENGLLVKEKDVEGIAKSINRLLKDESLAKKLVCNAFKTAEFYSYERIGKMYKQIINIILEGD